MPEMTIRLLASLGLLIVFAGIAFGGGFAFFNYSSYQPPTRPEPVVSQDGPVDLPSNQALRPFSPAPSGGLVLIDATHRNSFRDYEIVDLLSKISGSGYTVEFVGQFTTTDAGTRSALYEEKLRQADALVVILPRDAYTAAEADLVGRFVRKGGKLLLISDPSRLNRTNTLAERFGLNFRPDYLYNQREYDLNFQNIFVRQFQPDAITAGVEEIALYAAGSIQSSGAGVAFVDANTESSVEVTGEGLSPIAWGNSRNVLAINDFTFLVPPQSSVLDNDQLLSNVVDFLTGSTREYDLGDFPYFFPRDPAQDVDIVIAQPSLLGSGTTVKNGLAEHGIAASLQTTEDFGRDTVFLGLHDDALRVSGYLHSAGIQVGDSLSGPFGDDLSTEATAISVLDPNRERHVLIILADTPENLDKAVSKALDGTYRQDLVNDFASVTTFATASK